nr:MAG TPA: hypothetical protein [Caudoviricetes sp.]
MPFISTCRILNRAKIGRIYFILFPLLKASLT